MLKLNFASPLRSLLFRHVKPRFGHPFGSAENHCFDALEQYCDSENRNKWHSSQRMKEKVGMYHGAKIIVVVLSSNPLTF